MALPAPAATSVVTMGYRGASRQAQVMDMDQAGFLKQTPLLSGFSDKEIARVLGTAPEIGMKMMAELARRLRDTDATLSD